MLISVIGTGVFQSYSLVERQIYREQRTAGSDGRSRYKGVFHRVRWFQDPRARFVAMAYRPFGEGKERFAYRFYELDMDRKTIVGMPLVAKESRYIIDEGIDDEGSRWEFVKQFCRTQQLSGRIAKVFNRKLASLRRVDGKTPRVEFLDCSVYRVYDQELGMLSVLVEERIDVLKWTKWNKNNGYVLGMDEDPEFTDEELDTTMLQLRTRDLKLHSRYLPHSDDFGTLEEGDEDEEDDESDGRNDANAYAAQANKNASAAQSFASDLPVVFTPFDVAHAFSHFSYWATGRKRLICDIQGVFCEETNKLRLSDPVIHYYSHFDEQRRMVHGRTDRGRKGMAMFWATHKCNYLCHLVTVGFKERARAERTERASQR